MYGLNDLLVMKYLYPQFMKSGIKYEIYENIYVDERFKIFNTF